MLTDCLCPLCGSSEAQIGPALIPGGGVRSGRLAVRCPHCRGYLVESLLKFSDIPVGVKEKIAQAAKLQYVDDGSTMLEVTSSTVQFFS